MKISSVAVSVDVPVDEDDHETDPSCLKGSKKLLWVIGLSVASTLIEVVAAMLLHSNIIMANVVDGSYEVVLLFVNWRGMIHEENGHRKAAIRFANVTDTMLILGCVFVFWGSVDAWNTPQKVNGLAIAAVSFLSVMVNLWALLICPRLGHNGRSAYVKVIGGNLLVVIGCLGGLLIWCFGYQQFDALAGGLVALILGCYVATTLKQRTSQSS